MLPSSNLDLTISLIDPFPDPSPGPLPKSRPTPGNGGLHPLPVSRSLDPG
jgi:hypothetical protein